MTFLISPQLPEMNSFPSARSVLVLDNASFHHSKEFLEPFYLAGVRVLFTPPYQPFFQPIESAFSKMKASLRRESERWQHQGCSDVEMIARALSTITSSDARGWILHCGYSFI
jgi:transposase